ncbi:ABC transporter ATP-binding protein [Actinomadura sp. NPDC048955]|uniref:ABC transporter ATP-binding protein n=1 Tax=Actinomadura sp. NPDC048955 TaxID=3158228 RepID=UPI0033F2461B
MTEVAERASGTPATGADEVVRLEAVRKVYGGSRRGVAALDGVTLRLDRGSFTAVMGPSGSGKSTLLHCAAGLERPTSGTVHLAGADLASLGERALTRLRRERIGFVFQSFNLLPELTVVDNVTLPLRLAGRRPGRGAAEEALERVGLGDRHRHRPAELSGGQQQRVAIARALITRPAVIFGDEPTGALDTGNARAVLELLREVVHEAGRTVVMVTHDPVAAAYADRVVFLSDGRIAGALNRPTPERVAEWMTRLRSEPAAGAEDAAPGARGTGTVRELW